MLWKILNTYGHDCKCELTWWTWGFCYLGCLKAASLVTVTCGVCQANTVTVFTNRARDARDLTCVWLVVSLATRCLLPYSCKQSLNTYISIVLPLFTNILQWITPIRLSYLVSLTWIHSSLFCGWSKFILISCVLDLKAFIMYLTQIYSLTWIYSYLWLCKNLLNIVLYWEWNENKPSLAALRIILKTLKFY